MSFQVFVNPEICLKLSKLSFKQFSKFYPDAETDKNGVILDMHTQYDLLINYCNKLIQNKYTLTETYSHSLGSLEGRIFVNGEMGMQRLAGKFRGVLCDELNVDLDMKNAHLSILLNLCKRLEIYTPQLKNYCKNRDEIIKTFMIDDNISKDQAKTIFICALNTDIVQPKYINTCIKPLRSRKIKNTFYHEFDAEMKKIQTALIPYYPEFYKFVSKRGKDNINGRFINKIICKIENEILQKAMSSLQKQKIIVNVPMFDGFMADISKSNKTTCEIVTQLNTLTKEDGILWDNKEHNIEILQLLNSLVFEEHILNFKGDNEVAIANYLLENLLKNKIYVCNGEVWLYQKPIWTNLNIDKLLIPVISPHNLDIKTPFGYAPANKSASNLKNIISLVMAHSPKKDDFYTIMHKDTKNRLFYNNGYYDFKINKFVIYDDENIPFTSFVIKRDYKENKSKVEDVFEKIFYPIFNVVRDENQNIVEDHNHGMMKYILYNLARKLAGHIEDKDFMFWIGERNSGKGVIQDLIMEAFEKYIGSFDSNVLIQKPTSCGEASKESAWMLFFEFTRIMFASEFPIKTDMRGRHTIKMNGTLLKKLSSGGDKLQARGNNKDAREFQIQSSIVLVANDVPLCEPTDALKTMTKFNMPSKFMNKEDFNLLTLSEQLCCVRKEPDNDLKEWCKAEDVKEAIEYILFESYKTKQTIPDFFKLQALKDNNNNNDNEKLEEVFEINRDPDSFLSNKDITETLATNNIAMTQLKAKKLLMMLGAVEGTFNNQRGLNGLKVRN